MKKNWLALVLAACMLCTLLAGCNGNTPSGPTVGVTGEDGPMVPYAETLKIDMMYERNPGVAYVDGDSIENNVITRFIKEKLNMEFDLSWQVDKGNYNTQLDLAIAGNTELPDLFIGNVHSGTTDTARRQGVSGIGRFVLPEIKGQ